MVIVKRITRLPLTLRPHVAFEFQHYKRHQRKNEYPREDRHEPEVHRWMLKA